MSKIKKIKKKIYEFGINSTSHGLPNLFRADKIFLRLMWFFLFICSSSYSVYLCVDNLSKYLGYEVISKIDVVSEMPAELPTITFYNLKDSSANESLETILVLCHFNDKTCNNTDIQAGQDKFGYYFYRFKSKITYFAGSFSEIRFLILFSDTYAAEDSFREGIRVIIHNQTNDPRFYGGFSDEGVDVAPGFITSIGLNRIYSTKLGEPYNKCLKDVSSMNSYDSEIYKYILTSTNYSYRQKDCFQYCMGREFYKNLNQTDKIDYLYNVFETLNIVKENLLDLYYELINGEAIKVCNKECPLECDSTRYDVSVSLSKITLDNVINLTDNKIFLEFLDSNLSYVKSNLIGFSVYYNDLKYTQISQIPKLELIDLISNIGGILGLFIGISFLSVFELLALFFEFLIIIFDFNKVQV